MKTRLWSLAVVVCLVVPAAAVAAPFDKGEDAARRGRLMEKIADGAAVVLGATTPAGDYEFRQGHDFLYLTGVEIPDAFLVIDATRKESVLFFRMDEKTADGEGIPVDLVRKPAEFTGIERVLPAGQFGLTWPAWPSAPGPSTRCSSPRKWDARQQREVQRASEDDDAHSVGRASHTRAAVRHAAAREVPQSEDSGDPVTRDYRAPGG